jgi:hypothetical protein
MSFDAFNHETGNVLFSFQFRNNILLTSSHTYEGKKNYNNKKNVNNKNASLDEPHDEL